MCATVGTDSIAVERTPTAQAHPRAAGPTEPHDLRCIRAPMSHRVDCARCRARRSRRPRPSRSWIDGAAARGPLAADFRLDAGLVAIFVASRIVVVGGRARRRVPHPPQPGAQPRGRRPDPAQPDELGWLVLPRASSPTATRPTPVAGAYSNVAFPPLYPALVKLLSLPIPGIRGRRRRSSSRTWRSCSRSA